MHSQTFMHILQYYYVVHMKVHGEHAYAPGRGSMHIYGETSNSECSMNLHLHDHKHVLKTRASACQSSHTTYCSQLHGDCALSCQCNGAICMMAQAVSRVRCASLFKWDPKFSKWYESAIAKPHVYTVIYQLTLAASCLGWFMFK